MSRPLRVVVVDDSAFNRRLLTGLLTSIPHTDVVGKAANGEEALRVVLTEKPDLITLDLEMPRMDGFTFLRLVMARQPTAVLVISGRSAKSDVFKALELGALDFIIKPSATVSVDLSEIRETLEEKVEMVRHLKPMVSRERRSSATALALENPAPRAAAVIDSVPKRIVVIGASTGGPPALVDVCSRLPGDLPAAVLIAQHMPERFTKTFAERLQKLGRLRVSELTDREVLRSGRAWVCAGGRCMELTLQPGGVAARARVPDPDDRFVPSVDRLFRSAAMVYGARTIGVVMTGMGDDGTKGAEAIKKVGGTVLVESEETAAIFGMPGAVVRAGHADRIVPLSKIADEIIQLCQAPLDH